MEIRELALPEVFLVKPRGFPDERGVFYESFRQDLVSEAVGRPFTVAQSNLSVSRRGTLRGLHGTRGPRSQAKLVTCVRGAVLDIVVDLRVGSPNFGQHAMVWLNAESMASVYIGEDLAHSFLALEDNTSMHYYCSMTYDEDAVYKVDPRDPDLDLPWGLTGEPIQSDADLKAPSLATAIADKLLPVYTGPGPR
ncbi:dTDP-4-dehydrorhamnose 3,5-epimerase/NDP-hexose 3,5-(Or5-) epimerasee [Amycolatopsis xylanica]|uniref:dTDP-4-dehydrorhamnose 3,5-epimerase/NDP-hexose 3,5-(Or5-) epimerasee n=2 Tax=Amycolatopsis xylanica TaxID=589385 RepID=A0A1H2VRQ4_9PSEU|nr:dTDP-4-dehydrorhamnose 3,5-epimerase/NDP-hexose 3,5-(Or5-) epimerasee [Amycolatopsis xylanica]